MKENQEFEFESEKEKSNLYVEFPSFCDDLELENSGNQFEKNKQAEWFEFLRQSLHQNSFKKGEKQSKQMEEAEKEESEVKP